MGQFISRYLIGDFVHSGIMQQETPLNCFSLRKRNKVKNTKEE